MYCRIITKANVCLADFRILMEALWIPLIEMEYSFVVTDETNRIVGVSLNCDASDGPELRLSGALETVHIFVDQIEKPFK